jgi:hypothetical protein
VRGLLQVLREANGNHRVKHMLQHRFVSQQGLQLVRDAAGRFEVFASVGGEHDYGGFERLIHTVDTIKHIHIYGFLITTGAQHG